MLGPWRGGPCPITVEYAGNAASGALTLGTPWTVRPSRELLGELESLLGPQAVQVVYATASTPVGAAISADGR